jgi:hypothetical protein
MTEWPFAVSGLSFDSEFWFRTSGFRPLPTQQLLERKCIMLLVNRINRRNRGRFDPSNVPAGSDATPTLAIVTGKVVVTLSVACSLKGIPQVRVQGQPPTAAVMLTPSSCQLTYAAVPVAGNTYFVPGRDPALRTRNGGYVAAKAGTF